MNWACQHASCRRKHAAHLYGDQHKIVKRSSSNAKYPSSPAAGGVDVLEQDVAELLDDMDPSRQCGKSSSALRCCLRLA